jgi:hypothetical protein
MNRISQVTVLSETSFAGGTGHHTTTGAALVVAGLIVLALSK